MGISTLKKRRSLDTRGKLHDEEGVKSANSIRQRLREMRVREQSIEDTPCMDMGRKKLQVTWNLKFKNQRKEMLYWRSVLANQNLSFSSLSFSVLFLFCIVQFLSNFINNLSMVQYESIGADRPLDCLNCIDGMCSFAFSSASTSVSLPRKLDNSLRVVPKYTISPMQLSAYESDNLCPEDTKFEHAIDWVNNQNGENSSWINQEIHRVQDSRGCNLLLSGFLTTSGSASDLSIIGIFLALLLMQVFRSIWDYRGGSQGKYDPWNSGYSFIEREQDKARMRTRDQIQKLCQSRKHHTFFDLSDSRESAEEDFEQRLTNLQHKIVVFFCFLAYSVSIYGTIFDLRGSSRFGGGLLINEECPEGEFDLNSASLVTKGLYAGHFESIFTWSHHGFKYIFGVAAIHFSGFVRFLTLFPISVLFCSVTLVVMMSYSTTAELRIAYIVIPFIHILFLSVVYQVEYTDRVMWDIQRTMHKTTVSQRKVCEDMLPKTALKAILRDSLDLAYRNDHVTFLFSDIVGFTNFSKKVEAGQVLRLLQSLFVHFDFMVSYYGLFKVCTIGDAYVAITQPTNAIGLGKRNVTLEDIAGFVNILQFGYTMLKRVNDVKNTLKITQNPRTTADLNSLAMRIGLHHGTCVGGIIGSGRIRYDIWGVDVLLGECMEQNGLQNELHVSEPWKDFYVQYPVTSILSNMSIEDAADYPMSKITFQFNCECSLKIDKSNQKTSVPSPGDHTNKSWEDGIVSMNGYLLKPSWCDMMLEQEAKSRTKGQGRDDKECSSSMEPST